MRLLGNIKIRSIQSKKNEDYKEFASKLLIADVKIIEGTHSIYLYAPDEIYKIAMDFIKNKVVKN